MTEARESAQESSAAGTRASVAAQAPARRWDRHRAEYMSLLWAACARNEDDLLEVTLAYHLGIDPYVERSARFDALVEAERTHREAGAKERATALLLDHLTEEQRRQYRRHGCFDVVGGESAKRYRIWQRTMQNIEELDSFGQRVCVWCVHPLGVPMADVLLAQKAALELFESETLRIAHRYSGFAANCLSDIPTLHLPGAIAAMDPEHYARGG
jgi:hypothetical protein